VVGPHRPARDQSVHVAQNQRGGVKMVGAGRQD
jgi:hypothetical protein